MSKRLIAYIGDKGGSGKSFGATVHATVLHRAGLAPVLVDTDGEVGHLARMFGVRDKAGMLLKEQPPEGVRRFKFHQDERDRVEIASILDEGHELVLIDLPAASVTLLRAMEADYGFFRLAHENGYAVTLVVVVTPDEASLASVRAAAALDPLADLVMLRNAAFGDKEDFVVWDGSVKENIKPAKGKAVLAERNGADLTLPMLNRGTVALVGALKISFEKAASTSSPLHSGRRSQVYTWLAKVESEFAKANVQMGLPAPSAAAEAATGESAA
jgi:hypothetical protein